MSSRHARPQWLMVALVIYKILSEDITEEASSSSNGSRIKFVPKVKVILKSEIKVLLSKKTRYKKEILSSFIKILNYKAS